MIVEADESPKARLTRGFQLVLGRRPSSPELQVLQSGLNRFANQYQQNVEAAKKLIAQGQSKSKVKVDSSELAAYTAIASLMLNLDSGQ